MRDIKFRAWHSDYGEMVYSSDNWEYGKREFTPFLFEVGFSNYPKTEWEVMQFTGLKDKNGKEIYEGDILQTIGGLIGEVVFENCRWLLKRKNGTHGLSHERANDCQVVGNIYEHKPLLTP